MTYAIAAVLIIIWLAVVLRAPANDTANKGNRRVSLAWYTGTMLEDVQYVETRTMAREAIRRAYRDHKQKNIPVQYTHDSRGNLCGMVTLSHEYFIESIMDVSDIQAALTTQSLLRDKHS